MKTLNGLIALTTLLAFQVPGLAHPQEEQPAAQQSALAVEVTYLKGTAPSFLQIYEPAPDGKPRGSWYARFGRLPDWQPPEGSLPTRAVQIVPRIEEDAVRIEVSVHVGKQFFDKELRVASYLLREGENVSAEALTKFGVEPFEFRIVRLKPDVVEPPLVVNKTSSLEVVNIEVIMSRRPTYLLSLRNASDKNITAIEVNVFVGDKLRMSGWPRGLEGQPLIAAGAVYRERVLGAEDVIPRRFAYEPNSPPAQSVVIRVVLFEDGSYEGDPAAAAQFTGQTLGTRIQLTRVFALLQSTAEMKEGKASDALATLTKQVSALGTDVPSSVTHELAKRFPSLDQKERSDLSRWVQSSLHKVRKQLLGEIEEFRKSHKQSADEEFSSWLAANTEKYKQWLSRL
jgi:hypothetical protein